jgi:hypothetical protein
MAMNCMGREAADGWKMMSAFRISAYWPRHARSSWFSARAKPTFVGYADDVDGRVHRGDGRRAPVGRGVVHEDDLLRASSFAP